MLCCASRYDVIIVTCISLPEIILSYTVTYPAFLRAPKSISHFLSFFFFFFSFLVSLFFFVLFGSLEAERLQVLKFKVEYFYRKFLQVMYKSVLSGAFSQRICGFSVITYAGNFWVRASKRGSTVHIVLPGKFAVSYTSFCCVLLLFSSEKE